MGNRGVGGRDCRSPDPLQRRQISRAPLREHHARSAGTWVGSDDAIAFIKPVQPKHARQILLKIIELCGNQKSGDCQPLKGSPEGYWRADIGEYRIIFREVDDTLEVSLIGKRNDDEVYKRLSRK